MENEPTRGSLRWRISWNSSFGWLFGMFLFRHWKNHPPSRFIPGSLQSNLAILSKVFLNSVTWRSALQSTLFPRHLYHNHKRQISRSAIWKWIYMFGYFKERSAINSLENRWSPEVSFSLSIQMRHGKWIYSANIHSRKVSLKRTKEKIVREGVKKIGIFFRNIT